MEKSKINTIVSLIILLMVVAAFGYYFFLPGKDNDVDSNGQANENIENLSDGTKSELDILMEALAQEPDNTNFLLKLGVMKKISGDYKGAEEAWVKVGELSPKNSTSFGNLADLYVNFLKDYDKAIPAYETAILNSQNEAKNVSFYRNYFEFYLFFLEDKGKAESVLLEAIIDNQNSPDLYTLLGNFYKDEGKIVKAIEAFEKSYELDPENDLIREEIEKLK